MHTSILTFASMIHTFALLSNLTSTYSRQNVVLVNNISLGKYRGLLNTNENTRKYPKWEIWQTILSNLTIAYFLKTYSSIYFNNF